jgi:GH43 family beta-xylosidase/alpha-L-arabinofuranosidase
MHRFPVFLLTLATPLLLPVGADTSPDWTNPVIEQRADPHVYLHSDGYYYLTATAPEYDRIELRRARSIDGLADAKAAVIWRKHDRGEMGAHIWAPEIHHLGGKWYLHFTAAPAEQIWEIRPHVLECAGPDPLTDRWLEKGKVRLAWESFSLDATTFAHAGKRYYVWTQRGAAPYDGTNIYIAEMDSPTSIKGQPVMLTHPEYAWETRGHRVNEAPAVLIRHGRVFLTYSASATDANYCLGMLTASAAADLLDPKAWTKSRQPVLESSRENSQFGPGHNCFTTTPDGKTDILVYHARSYGRIEGDPLHNPDRAIRAQAIKWTSDGMPVFGGPVANGPYTIPADLSAAVITPDSRPNPGIPADRVALTPSARAADPAEALVTVATDRSVKMISPDLFGIFFEDINYAADGGLYAELIQNRSFEYTPGDRKEWNSLTAWGLVERGGGKGDLTVEADHPLHVNNPHYAVINATGQGGAVGLRNAGFDGIVLKAGELYDFAVFARQLEGVGGPLEVRLEDKDGAMLAVAALPQPGPAWTKLSVSLKSARDADDARLVLTTAAAGKLGLDMISLFPRKTYQNRPNGLRPDLAQAIADLKPKFVRFPGGCLAHGDGLDNLYRWQHTVGPVETRKAQRNIWRYHQTTGLGYFEYFQFCEDIGAKPLPVVPAGVCCQNAGHYIPGAPRGQQHIPMGEMAAYIQEVLDLIEWANGPATSKWGAVRAAAGHPEPFHLEYLGVGNEDQITPGFEERFAMIHKAVKAKHPEIIVIGTVGPAASGEDFERGWKLARQLRLEMVDEHYYMAPEWFLAHQHRYDSYDRNGPKVYLGEYASKGNTLFNALAEAAYMTSLERNGDVVRLASYAPLLAKTRHTQWHPDLIYFDNTALMLTANYHVQRLFGENPGDIWLPNTVKLAQPIVADTTAGVFLGTWETQAEFDNVRLESGTARLLDDTFTRPSDRWRAEAGDWMVANGVYQQAGSPRPALARAAARIPVKSGAAHYTLSLRARKTGGAEGFLIGFGATDADHHYWWNLGGWGNRSHGIEKGRRGAMTPVGPQVPGHIEAGRWYDVRIVVEGPRIRCYLDRKLIHDLTDDPGLSSRLAVSSVIDSKTGDMILKLVNAFPSELTVRIALEGPRAAVLPSATCTVLSGEPEATNSFSDPVRVAPKTSERTVGSSFSYPAPPHSLSVIRLRSRN